MSVTPYLSVRGTVSCDGEQLFNNSIYVVSRTSWTKILLPRRIGQRYANCPPQILSYKYKNERSVAFKLRQNPFSAGAPPQTPLGKLTTLPQTPLSDEEGTTLPIPYPTRHQSTFGPRHASPQNSSQIYAYGYSHICNLGKTMA